MDVISLVSDGGVGVLLLPCPAFSYPAWLVGFSFNVVSCSWCSRFVLHQGQDQTLA